MPRLFDGSRFSIALLAGAVTVLTLMVLGLLVLSGQLPPAPTGLVTGDVRAGMGGAAAGQRVIFERIDGPDVVTVHADARGHFSARVPPGQYYVDMQIAACPNIGPCGPRRDFFPIGIKVFAIGAGQHLELQLGTCGDVWQCPRPVLP
jgi:hypothetical protein